MPKGDHEAGYIPEIDGLRALAVIAVIANHFHHRAVPSGFLGVDVFFVISGFVITASLAQRPSTGLGALMAGFYARRIRRLLPALVVCSLVAIVLARVIIPDPTVSLATGRRAVFGISNLLLYDQATDYFGASIRLNVFMHTWSLGVEEQFYFVFPFLVWFTGFGRRETGARALASVMIALSAASLVAWIYASVTAPSAAYYLMPMRLWEIGLGCIAYLLVATRRPVWLARVRPHWLCLVLIGVQFAPRHYIVASTITAVALTALLVGSLGVRTAPSRWLRHPVVVYIGRISYSLYLWHWIVLCFGRWTVGLHASTIPVMLAAVALLAVATFHGIEMPLRRTSTRRRWLVITSGLVAAALVASLSLFLEKRPDLAPEATRTAITLPPAYVAVAGSGVAYDPWCVIGDGADRILRDNTLDLCTAAPTRPGAPTIWTLGDSHAGHLQGMLYAAREQAGVGVHLVETPGVAFPMTKDGWFEPRDALFQQITERLQPGDVVLIARLYVNRAPPHEPLADLPAWLDEVERLASSLAQRGVTLVVAGPPPMFEYEDIGLCRSGFLGGDSCDIARASIAPQLGAIYRSLGALAARHANLVVFDELSVLCPGPTCSPLVDRVARFRDRDHLNTFGAAELAGPFVELLRRRGLLR